MKAVCSMTPKASRGYLSLHPLWADPRCCLTSLSVIICAPGSARTAEWKVFLQKQRHIPSLGVLQVHHTVSSAPSTPTRGLRNSIRLLCNCTAEIEIEGETAGVGTELENRARAQQSLHTAMLTCFLMISTAM